MYIMMMMMMIVFTICVQVQVPQPTMYPNVWSISGDQDY